MHRDTRLSGGPAQRARAQLTPGPAHAASDRDSPDRNRRERAGKWARARVEQAGEFLGGAGVTRKCGGALQASLSEESPP